MAALKISPGTARSYPFPAIMDTWMQNSGRLPENYPPWPRVDPTLLRFSFQGSDIQMHTWAFASFPGGLLSRSAAQVMVNPDLRQNRMNSRSPALVHCSKGDRRGGPAAGQRTSSQGLILTQVTLGWVEGRGIRSLSLDHADRKPGYRRLDHRFHLPPLVGMDC